MGTIMLQAIPKKTGVSQESNIPLSIQLSEMVFNTVSSLSISSLYRSYHRSAYRYGHRRYVR